MVRLVAQSSELSFAARPLTRRPSVQFFASRLRHVTDSLLLCSHCLGDNSVEEIAEEVEPLLLLDKAITVGVERFEEL